MKIFNKVSVILLGITFMLGVVGLVFAVTAVNLGTAANFAILGGSTVTNTGTSVINGDLGLSPGTSVTGFPPGTLNGTQYVNNATAAQAQSDLVTAYNNAAGQTPVDTVPTELGGTTKTAGVYNSASGTFGITGTLTLDAQGDANSVFVFKTATTLITGGASDVLLVNGAQ
ncbi:MAG: ice-binding family protein, partial [bacterium]|nr:ice-binding family protein [bacterium]